MKNALAPLVVFIAAGAGTLLPAFVAPAADTTSTSQPTIVVSTPTDAAVTAPPKLPYGVDDVLKLSRAQVSEDIVLNYVRNSGTIYNLGPQDIIYLRGEGVSSTVLNAMLAQRQRVPEATAQAAVQAASTAQAAATVAATTTAPVAAYQDVAPTYVTPPVADVETAPASTLYIISSPSVRAAYYGCSGYYCSPYGYYSSFGCYPSYYPYCRGYYGPAVSVGVRFGGHGHFGGHSSHFHH